MSILNTKLIFRAKSALDGIPVDGSANQQVIFMHVKHQDSHYVLLYDYGTGCLYVERLKSLLRVNLYVSDNFEKIEDDTEWKEAYNALELVEIND